MFQIEVGETLLFDGKPGLVTAATYDEFNPDLATHIVVQFGEVSVGIDLTKYDTQQHIKTAL